MQYFDAETAVHFPIYSRFIKLCVPPSGQIEN